jgi:hypothetical protein
MKTNSAEEKLTDLKMAVEETAGFFRLDRSSTDVIREKIADRLRGPQFHARGWLVRNGKQYCY